MFSKMLVFADLHFTINKSDEYRWEVIPWMVDKAKELGVHCIVWNGDVTDYKDNHSSEMVNKLVDSIKYITSNGIHLHINKGNHDYLNTPELPFFSFLEGLSDKVSYYVEPKVFKDDGVVFLPYTATPENDWSDLITLANDYRFIFIHQPCIGAKSSDFYELEHGLDPKFFSSKVGNLTSTVIAGDIHLHQKIGDVQYVGSPYPIRFGDNIKGRCCYINGDDIEWFFIPTIKKPHYRVKNVEALEGKDIQVGDKVKVTISLSTENHVNWQTIKKQATDYILEKGAESCGVYLEVEQLDQEDVDEVRELSEEMVNKSDSTILDEYCKLKGIDEEYRGVGSLLVESVS